MLELRGDTMLTLPPQVVLHSIPDQDWYYVFNVTSGDQFKLNLTSYWVLEHINGGMKYNILERDFLDMFEVPEDQGGKDLEQLVRRFIRRKIVRRQIDAKKEDAVSKAGRRKAK